MDLAETARGHLTAGEIEDALSFYERALRLQHRDPALHIEIGQVFNRLQEHMQAISHHETALRLDPDNEDAETLLALELAGEGRSEEARALAQRLIDRRPHDPESYLTLSLVLDILRDYKGVVEVYDRMLEIDPTLEEIRMARESVGALEGAETLGSPWMTEALSYDEARRAVQTEPDNPVAQAALGRTLAELDLWPGVVEAYATAVRLAPDVPVYWFALGRAYINVGDLEQALAALRRAEELGYQDTERSWELPAVQANVLRRLGRPDEAIAIYRKIFDTNESSRRLLIRTFVAVLYEAGQYKEAWQLAERASAMGLPLDTETLADLRAALEPKGS